ncbi:ATP:cob(I)alamin adenosyltransferase, partial [Patescibacteria group bacterium]|nr:ATP:cob(I)alamin adenosyltransferase [Patescibacteria group bacterium]MBU1970445.1 ATP:cob(I)alamin adenosyltransferase [Patescibacteria group bacterium]
YLGWACLMVTRIHAKQLAKIQTDLFWLGAILAGTAKKPGRRDDLTKRVAQLETELTTLEPQLPPLAQFILPGGCESACRLHLARAVCRRCERSLVALGKHAQLIPYLNRLSDFLFVLARFENYRHKVEADFVNWPPR